MPTSQDAAATSGQPPFETSPLYRAVAFEKTGPLIAVEGPDGSGKTTVMERIQFEVAYLGREVLLSNWNDAAQVYNLSQQLTAEGELEPYVRLVLGAAELAARYQYEIVPALSRGAVVILNKYLVSAMAHSRIRGHDPAFVRKVYRFALAPDILLYFDVEPAVALARKGRSVVPGFWESGLDLATDAPVHEAMRRYSSGEMDPSWVRSQFVVFQSQLRALQVEELRHWSNVVMVDASKDLDDVVQATRAAVLPIIAN